MTSVSLIKKLKINKDIIANQESYGEILHVKTSTKGFFENRINNFLYF
jgi:hypothetical protein